MIDILHAVLTDDFLAVKAAWVEVLVTASFRRCNS